MPASFIAGLSFDRGMDGRSFRVFRSGARRRWQDSKSSFSGLSVDQDFRLSPFPAKIPVESIRPYYEKSKQLYLR
jgi:hypothetical protein